MIDFTLTEEQEALQRTAREFANREIRPVAAALDKIADPNGISIYDILKKGAEVGFNKMLRPEAFGGLGLGMRDLAIVIEELAAADSGVALNFILLESLLGIMLQYGNEEQRQRILPKVFEADLYPVSVAFTESNRASADFFSPNNDPNEGMQCFARREDDHFVINGSKSAWVTGNGPHTLAYLVVCRTDFSKPQSEALSMFYVPRDTPGLTVGKQTDKIGMRLPDHAEIFFDDVRVPVEDLIGPEGAGQSILEGGLIMSSLMVGCCGVGLAREATEYAIAYAKERRSWGKPIIQHQAVATMLIEMQTELEMVRGFIWNAAANIDRQLLTPETMRRCCMAKVYGSEMASRVSEKAMNVLGGFGLSKEYPLEKLHRDAVCMPIMDGHNIMWRLRASSYL